MSGGATIDWSVLGSICGRDEALLRRLLEAFLKDARQDLLDLDHAFQSRVMADVSRVAHRIYGASRTVGAVELAQISAALDAASLADEIGRVSELLPHVRRQYGALAEAIGERLRSAWE